MKFRDLKIGSYCTFYSTGHRYIYKKIGLENIQLIKDIQDPRRKIHKAVYYGNYDELAILVYIKYTIRI